MVPSTSLNVALHLAKNVTIVKRKITFLICVEVSIITKAMAMIRDLNLKIPDSVIDHHDLESSQTFDDSKWYSYEQESV